MKRNYPDSNTDIKINIHSHQNNYTNVSEMKPKNILRQTFDSSTPLYNWPQLHKISSHFNSGNNHLEHGESINHTFNSHKKIASTNLIPLQYTKEQRQISKHYPQSVSSSIKCIDEAFNSIHPNCKNSKYSEGKTLSCQVPYNYQQPIVKTKENNNENQQRKINAFYNGQASKNILYIPTSHDYLRTTYQRPKSPISAKIIKGNQQQHFHSHISTDKKSLMQTLDNTPKNSPESMKHHIPQKENLCIQHFFIDKKLGEGKFGEVFRVLHKKTHSLFALKRVKKISIKSYLMQQQFLMEIKMQLFFNNPYILKLYAVFNDSGYIYLLLEYMQQGTLYAKMKKTGTLSEEMASCWMSDVIKGVNFLHQNGVAHRDIKPQNIVMTNGTCKLCDLGWSAICKDDRRSTLCGTLDYSAPEILEGKQYGRSIDLWCLGVLTFELLVGKAPFYHYSKKQTMRKIMNQNHEEFKLPNTLSKKAKGFINRLILWQPDQRMSANQALQDPFIKDYANSQL